MGQISLWTLTLFSWLQNVPLTFYRLLLVLKDILDMVGPFNWCYWNGMPVGKGHESLSNIFTDKIRNTMPLHQDTISNTLKNEGFIWARRFHYVLLHFIQKDPCNKSTSWVISYWNTLWTHHSSIRLLVSLTLPSASPWSYLQLDLSCY